MKHTYALTLCAFVTGCSSMAPARFVAPAFDLSGARSVDASRWVWGALRAVVSDRRVTLAPDALDAVILAAAETPAGWLFVDGRGRVSTASGFLATPADLGAVPASEDLSCRAARGRVACLSDAVLWTTDGSAPPSIVDPGCGALLSAAFADATRGAVICEGGVVSSTRDGGRSWRLSPMLHGRAFRAIAVSDGALFATDNELAARIGDDGSLTEADVPPAEYDARRSEVEPRITAAASMRFPAHWERLVTATSAQRRDDGGFVWVDPNRYFLGVFRQDDGAPLEGPGARFSPDHYEDLSAWGDGLALLQAHSLLRAPHGVDFHRVTSTEGLHDLRLSDDGEHAVALGRLGPAPASEALYALDGARWRAVRLARTPSITLGMHRELALVAVCNDAPPSRACDPWVVDTRDGSAAALASDALEGALTPDGTAVLLTAPRGRDDVLREVALGPLDGSLTRHALPAGALAVAFADRRRGVAVGATTDQLWRTLDGAASWERLTVPERVLAPHTPLLEASAQSMASWSTPLAYQLHCDDRRCHLTGRLALVGWGPVASSPPPSFTAPVAPRTERPQTSVLCEFDATSAAPRPLTTRPRDASDVLDELPVAQGEALRRRDLGVGHEEVSLVGADGQIRWTRSFYFDGMHTSYAVRRWRMRGLATRDGVAGYAVESEGARPSVRFFPLTSPNEAPISLGGVSLAEIGPCDDPHDDAIALRVVTPDAMPTLSLTRVTPGLGMGFGSGSEDPRALATFELRRDGFCLRGLRQITPASSDGGLAALRFARGRIEGRYVDGDGSHPLRCQVEARER